jgi:hypothetical protein
MEDTVSKLKTTRLFISIVIALYIFGLVYELSFFAVLGRVDGFFLLSWKHFIYSGYIHALIFPTISAIIVLFIFAVDILLFSLKIFFSKEALLNKTISERLDERNQKRTGIKVRSSKDKYSFGSFFMLVARFFMVFNYVFWIATILFFPTHISEELYWILLTFIFYANSIIFLIAVIKGGEKNFVMMIIVATFSVTPLVSAFGVKDAAHSMSMSSNNKHVRDDSIVLIERQENSYMINERKITLPFLIGKLLGD